MDHQWTGKLLGAAAIIQNNEGSVLLVKHSYGMLNWEIPGGRAEANESVAETAVRETLEETGLHVVAERLTGIYYEPEKDAHHFVYLCTRTSEQPELISEETTDCGFFPVDDLPRPISDFTIKRIQDALSGNPVTCPVSIGLREWLT